MDFPSHIMQQVQIFCSVHTQGSQSHKGFLHSSLIQSIPAMFPPKHLALARIRFYRHITCNDNFCIHMAHICLSYQYQQNRHKSFHNELHVHNFYRVPFNRQHIIRNDNSCILHLVLHYSEVPALTHH